MTREEKNEIIHLYKSNKIQYEHYLDKYLNSTVEWEKERYNEYKIMFSSMMGGIEDIASILGFIDELQEE